MRRRNAAPGPPRLWACCPQQEEPPSVSLELRAWPVGGAAATAAQSLSFPSGSSFCLCRSQLDLNLVGWNVEERCVLNEITLRRTVCQKKFESFLSSWKIKKISVHFVLVYFRTVRKEYITAKYVDHRFSRKTCSSSSAKLNELLEAVKSRDLLVLVQVYAEGVGLMEPLLEPGQVTASPKAGWGGCGKPV